MNEESIEGMLAELMHEVDLETLQGSRAEFVKSLNEFYAERGFLSEKQQASLRKIFRDVF